MEYGKLGNTDIEREFYRLLLGQPKRSIWMIQPEHLTLN